MTHPTIKAWHGQSKMSYCTLEKYTLIQPSVNSVTDIMWCDTPLHYCNGE